MGRSIYGEAEVPNYFPIEQPQTLPPPLPQQIRASPGLSQKVKVKGFRFNDNKSKYRWEEGKNGIPQLNFDSFLPPSMTLCMRGRIFYNRHGDHNDWFNLIIKRRKSPYVPMDFALKQRSKGEWQVRSMAIVPSIIKKMNKEEQDIAKEAKSWPSRNSVRKWAHVCVVGDFVKDKTTLFLNGKKINETEFPFSKSFPDDYYSSIVR